MIIKSWSEFKSFVDSKEVAIQWLDIEDHYHMYANDGPFELRHIMKKTSSADQTDFEDNYKDDGNTKLEPLRDADNAVLSRTKITESGWHFQAHCLEFKTSELGSDYNKDEDEVDLGFTTLKCYNSSDVELTAQGDCDTDATRTVVTWEATHDVEVIGGKLSQTTAPATDTRLWIRAVPDVPKVAGGSVDFAQGGVNLKTLGDNGELDLDGKTAKLMNYDATYHTNKFRFTVRHDAGQKHCVMFVVYMFKRATD